MAGLELVVRVVEGDTTPEGVGAHRVTLRYGERTFETDPAAAPTPQWGALFSMPFEAGLDLEVELLATTGASPSTRGVVTVPFLEPCQDLEQDLWHELPTGSKVRIVHCVASPARHLQLLQGHIEAQARRLVELQGHRSGATQRDHNRLTSCLQMVLGPKWARTSALLIALLAVIWVLAVVDLFLPEGERLRRMGIYPRTAQGLIGVVSAPFLHYGLTNALMNSIGLVLFGLILAGQWGLTTYLAVSAWCAVVGDFVTWCAGSAGDNHISFAGVALGQLGYIVVASLFQRPLKLKRIALTLVIGVLYVLCLWGMFTEDRTVGWILQVCGGASGAVLGLLWALYLRRCRRGGRAGEGDRPEAEQPELSQLPSPETPPERKEGSRV